MTDSMLVMISGGVESLGEREREREKHVSGQFSALSVFTCPYLSEFLPTFLPLGVSIMYVSVVCHSLRLAPSPHRLSPVW